MNGLVLQGLDEARDVARIGDQQLASADPRHQQRADREREDVIERQRRHHHMVRRARRRTGASRPRTGARWRPRCGGAAMAPLATPVVPPVYCRNAMSSGETATGLRLALRTLRDDGLEGDRLRQLERLHRLLHVPRNQIDDRALEAEQIAGRRPATTRSSFSSGSASCTVCREVLEHEQEACAGILELMGELARRVERVDVDHGAAGQQDAEQDRRIGHHVRQHDRDPVALLQPLRPAARRPPHRPRGPARHRSCACRSSRRRRGSDNPRRPCGRYRRECRSSPRRSSAEPGRDRSSARGGPQKGPARLRWQAAWVVAFIVVLRFAARFASWEMASP